MGKKLDLSRLTDEEAKHVWEVVQRDFDLRKKEEERLENLKCKIEKESTKRELLSSQSHLNKTLCIHCLQPFKFLLKSKRQCLDCHLYICKSCSQYNKKEQGWMCDPCRLVRIVKTGSLEWYYEHVRIRFKHFGSAKVMRSLYGRMSHGQKTSSTLLDLRGRVHSLPDVTSDYHLYRNNGSEERETSDDVDGAESESYARMRKKKRLLSVHSFDFETDSEYSSQSRRQSVQLSRCPGKEDFQSTEDFPNGEEASMQKDSMVAEADLAAVFHRILQEQGKHTALPEQEFSTEVQFVGNSHTKNLETIPKAGSPWNVQPQLQYSAKVDTSDEDEKEAQETFIYQPRYTKHRSRASSQENVNHSGNQIFQLNKRISVIESMLSCLEEKILVHSEKPLAIDSYIDRSTEEKELKKKLEELTSSITEKAVSTDEENAGKKNEESKPEMDSSNDDLPPDAKKVPTPMENIYRLQKRRRELKDQTHHNATTDSELSELEGKVAFTVSEVQHRETEVSDIESRIAALSAAGLRVKAVERPKKKRSIQVMSVSHVLRKKFSTSHETASKAESFARNSYYRGSLTQRNPNGRNRKTDHIFAKPVMTHRS
ncbi:melanophilin isoform X1 [Ahaetulla prasina]|uniref:melanophilin isoform X1 n=1 Tax=Ahaetulla prasina TaxID=499056 RepID=UPI002648B129|nr:melanophilin isoform X1 [Ahaetulla prasina]XP_058040746.1 melanophilin isoform X1 [Ahaetulla prasina]XP_058040754.1 melanophilin isoform X1 [Ahaetulla prasina]XP_058040762.1 melanophilin isoform X1 [Ahaetulla prasina]